MSDADDKKTKASAKATSFGKYWARALQAGTPEYKERQQRLLTRKLRENPLSETIAKFIKKIEGEDK